MDVYPALQNETLDAAITSLDYIIRLREDDVSEYEALKNNRSKVFSARGVGGTPNAIEIPSVLPPDFLLADGTIIFFNPIAINTGPVFLDAVNSGSYEIVKPTPAGFVSLEPFDYAPSLPAIVVWSELLQKWQSLSSFYYGLTVLASAGFALGFGDLFNRFVATTALTINASAFPGTAFPSYYSFEVNAFGGNVTFTPFATNTVQGGAPGASYVLTMGTSGKFYKDINGNWWVN